MRPLFTLNNRLALCAEMVRKNSRIADIGTDHAYLPIYLIKTNKASHVLACDIRQKPLDNAAANVKKTNTENVELRLCDGLSGVEPHEVDTIVIAGMGGEVISGILNSCPWIKDNRYHLLLQPMTSADALRQFLCENGFEIADETAVEDNGKIYTIISCRYTNAAISVSDAFIFTGKLNKEREFDRKYIEKQLARLTKCRDDLKDIEGQKTRYLYYKNITDEIEKMLGGE